jgi:hypothetical protein
VESRRIVRVITSGFPEFVREVDIYDSTIAHIKEDHPSDFERFDQVISTIEGDATSIHESRTVKSAVVFVNAEVKNSSGDPLRVPVKVFSDGTGIMSTAYCADAKEHGELLWSREQGAVKDTYVATRQRVGRDDEK